jgi:DNA replication protein DnaC
LSHHSTKFGYRPFSPSGGAPLFYLLNKLYDSTSVVITTNPNFDEWTQVFGNAKLITALLKLLIHR